jgi:hypothetical protein
LAACLVAAVLAWTYGGPVRRAYRCVGDPPKVKTQHGCCPEDNPPGDSVGRPCCERLPVVAASDVTLEHHASSVAPPAAAVIPIATFLVHVAAFAPSRIRGGTSPPAQHPRASTCF